MRRLAMAGTVLLGAAALVALLPSTAARACGGFFCGPPPNQFDFPVAQTAENVLFAMDRDPSGKFRLEAHVQIFYTGPADRFSWVVPVDSQPVIGVGSDAVFSALLNATQPRFQLRWQTVGICKNDGRGVGNGAPGTSAPSSAGSGGSSGSSDPGSGVNVAFRGDVGPYDAAVIKSTNLEDPQPLLDWLAENGYLVTPDGARLIAEYVKEDKYFVAIRLLSEKGVNEIQPLVMTFVGPGPCVPLKRTSVAAIRDLKVNLWVLADQRVVPDNFYEIVINEARIDWFGGGSNYDELVKAAADEAGGNAFTTEYAGPTAMLARTLYQPGSYDLTAVRAAQDPVTALNGLFGFPRTAALLNVMRIHVPLPDALAKMGVTEIQFYNQLAVYWQQNQADFKPFSGEAFANDLEKRIVEPLRKAQALMDSHPKLTRLSTFISPEEMKVDPTFVMNASLADVPAVREATAYRVCGNQEYSVCEAPVRLELRDGQAIWFRPAAPQPVCNGGPGTYARNQLDAMPAMAVGWARGAAGDGQRRFDKTDQIRQAVVRHNVAAAQGDALPGGPTGGVPWTNPDGKTSSGSGCDVTGGGGTGAGGLPAELGALGLLAAALIWRRSRRGPRGPRS
jgi:hypothetical protein